MKRDMDLVRRIALATEALETGRELSELENVDNEEFVQHVEWMKEAGLVDAFIHSAMGRQRYAQIIRLTWQGCDFLDAARDDGLWAKAKATVIKPTASFTFSLLKDWLTSEIRQGLPGLGM